MARQRVLVITLSLVCGRGGSAHSGTVLISRVLQAIIQFVRAHGTVPALPLSVISSSA